MLTQIKEFLAGSLNGAVPTTNQIERTVREIPISHIRIDHTYQRDLDANFVAYLVENWNPEAVGLIHVAERALGYYAVDGQHRLAAMEQKGITHALCLVRPSNSARDEAQQFLDANKHRAVQLIYIFRAELTRGDERAVAINNLVRQAGWQINGDLGALARAGETCAIAALRQLYERNSQVLYHTMRLLIQAWPEETLIGTGKVLRGAFLFVLYGGEKIKPSRFVQVMTDIPLRTVMKRGDGLAAEQDLSPTMGFARQLAVEYNKGLRADQRVTFDAAD